MTLPLPRDPGAPADHGLPPTGGHPSAPSPLLRPVAAPSTRPWAGIRLAASGPSTGELWLAGPDLACGDGTGRTLDDLAASEGLALLGERPLRRYGARFPLIVKLIDAADWLSLQVHPDDRLATALYGADAVGKAEAWLVLAADPGAQLVTGPRPGLSSEALRAAIDAGTLDRDGCAVADAVPGDTLYVGPGTLHAIGRGTFVYEIEQPSDITFRISDWGRPPVPGRALHREESLRAVDPSLHAVPAGRDWTLDGGRLDTHDFRLELLGPGAVSERAPGGGSLEVVTALEGGATLGGEGWAARLERFDTAVAPASVAAYSIAVDPGGRVAVGSLA